MANGFSTFKNDHHYASGIILAMVGVVGVLGSVTGELANMMAALWVPDILYTANGSAASALSAGNIAGNTLNALTGGASNLAGGLVP